MTECHLRSFTGKNLLALTIGATVNLNIGHALQHFRQRDWLR
jgi:hypothetical protein